IGMIKLACTFIWLLRNYFCAQNLINNNLILTFNKLIEHTFTYSTI
ncbi:IS5 family transposase, partial [Francisella tularensis subsp. holarctica]